jgi:membrane protease YdiL (CAAX protease family)
MTQERRSDSSLGIGGVPGGAPPGGPPGTHTGAHPGTTPGSAPGSAPGGAPLWPPQPSPATRPGLGEAALLLLVMGLATAIALAAVYIGDTQRDLDMLMMGVLEVSAIALVLLIGVRRVGLPTVRVLALRAAPLWVSLAAVPLAMAVGTVNSALEAPVRNVMPIPEDFLLELVTLLYPQTTMDWILILLPTAVLVPIGEELLFRGLFLRGFLLRYGATPALALTSLLFAVVHLNPWSLVGYFIVGWVLGWIVLRSGSVWPAVILHGSYNALAVIQTKTLLDEPPTLESIRAVSESWWDAPVTIILSALALILLVLLIERRSRADHPWVADEISFGR